MQNLTVKDDLILIKNFRKTLAMLEKEIITEPDKANIKVNI
jgi:hypothetical protein